MSTAEVVPLRPDEDNETVKAALRYVAQGWRVIPVSTATKVPLTKDWPGRATRNKGTVRRTWGDHPEVGVGIVTGDGLVVIDLDVKNGVDGPGNWLEFLRQNGIELEETPVRVRTRSGGTHLYYRVPEGVEYRTSAGTLAKGVDVRANGGFVVAPGTAGYTFEAEWPTGVVLPELPAGVLSSVETQPDDDSPFEAEPRTPAEALAAAGNGLAEIAMAEPGERDNTLNRVAFGLAKFVYAGLLDEEVLREALLARAEESGLGRYESVATIESAFKAAKPAKFARLSTRDFLFGKGSEVRPIWGPDDTPLWVKGESLMIVGPPGVGKSTLAQSIVAARLGLVDDVLGYPVEDDGSNVLYIAGDRPLQISRGLKRHFSEEMPDRLLDRLVVISQSMALPDLGNPKYADWLLRMAWEADATTVIVDSLKDVVTALADDASANAYNRARQRLVANGLNLIELHHDRKKSNDGRGGGTGLDDVFGSRWLTAGAGSVLMLYPTRETDDDDVKTVVMRQLKSLMGEHSKVLLSIDTDAGLLVRSDGLSAIATMVMSALTFSGRVMTLAELVAAVAEMRGTDAATEYEAVKKVVQRLVSKNLIGRPGRGKYSLLCP